MGIIITCLTALLPFFYLSKLLKDKREYINHNGIMLEEIIKTFMKPVNNNNLNVSKTNSDELTGFIAKKESDDKVENQKPGTSAIKDNTDDLIDDSNVETSKFDNGFFTKEDTDNEEPDNK